MQILIVCGAGVSSTFVAKRIARAADAAGVAVSARPAVFSELAHADEADLVLLGPHLADRLDEASTLLSATPVAVLPEASLRDMSGRSPLDFALSVTAERAVPQADSPSLI